MSEPRWLNECEAQVWRGFIATQRELRILLERNNLRGSGLSGAEYCVLAPLSESPDGLLRARELGVELNWDRSRLSHQVSRMEKRGLVSREECASDARGQMVRLTDEGRKAIEAAAPAHVEDVRRLFFDLLTEEEQKVLGSVFDRILTAIAAEECS